VLLHQLFFCNGFFRDRVLPRWASNHDSPFSLLPE
jgi:hypothetical protein